MSRENSVGRPWSCCQKGSFEVMELIKRYTRVVAAFGISPPETV